MQHIAVCTQDPVLAKKIRFLLAGEGRDVTLLDGLEALSAPDAARYCLLVLSRSIDGRDTLDALQAEGNEQRPVILLGGERVVTPAHIHIVPDPVDTQAIYRLANEELPDRSDEADHATEPTLVEDGWPPEPPPREFRLAEDPHTEEGQAHMPHTTAPTALEPIAFSKQLFQIWSDSDQGVLIISQAEETLSVYFERGAPVHLESSIPGDRIGPSLVSRGRLAEAQYADAAKRAIERGTRLGAALVELNHIAEADLGQEMGASARDQIVACFGARDGSFTFTQGVEAERADPAFTLDVPHILSEGLHKHADPGTLSRVLGDSNERYFKLTKTTAELRNIFPLDDPEVRFLTFEGKAYNVSDAADISGLSLTRARITLALLTVCEEIHDFTPGVTEFEARIREERQRSRDLESQLPATPSAVPSIQPVSAGQIPLSGGMAPFPSAAPAPADGEAIPPMPVPDAGVEGTAPQALVYAKPLPRGVDGQLLDSPERSLSREHFQTGVKLLGDGAFSRAEAAFRNATALCSEEHVYLIGLARAIYYNPAYAGARKIPVLKNIVERAERLAPTDKRVTTLRSWVNHAESLVQS